MDLVIKNGLVVSSTETLKADIYILDGKINQIVSTETEKPKIKAKEEINADGMLIMPGGVDVHTHLDMPFMGTFSTDDFNTGSIAAAYGGTTSLIDYIIPQIGQSLSESINIWHQKAKNKSIIDYSFHMAIIPPIDKAIAELAELKRQGITSIKCFLAYKNTLMIDDKSLIMLMQEAKKQGILVCIHAEDGESIEALTKKHLQEQKTAPIYHALSRPSDLEEKAVEKVLEFAKQVNIPIYFVHLSTKDAFMHIEKARTLGQKVYTETCPQYLTLTQDEYLKPGFEGAKYVMSPPLREKQHKNYLLNSLNESIDVIATDHCPFNFTKEKQSGINDFTKIPNGAPGIETRMSLMFNEMVIKKGLSLNKFVELNCTKPAQIFGLKNKGDIKTGMDADIVIWNPLTKWEINVKELHQNVDYTPFENYTVTGKPVTVILRGNIIIRNGDLVENSCYGEFVKRT